MPSLKLVVGGLGTPPDVPPVRVAALRKAFDATVNDPEFLADAARQKLEINPIEGVKLQHLAEEIAKATGAVVERATSFLETDKENK